VFTDHEYIPSATFSDYELPGEGIDAELCMKLQSLLEEEKPEVLANAAMLGDVPTIREYLQKYPNEVCVDHRKTV